MNLGLLATFAGSLALALGCATAPVPEPAAGAATDSTLELHLRFAGWQQERGRLVVAIYADAASFEGSGPPHRAFRREVEGPTAEWSVELPPGAYGIKVYLDVDRDDELDRGAFGIPSEPYGFSNDARGSFGPPSWSAARFDLTGDATMALELR
ncbi:MAG: DUF2141 domain-containing protein [Acidobacteriota bacterium]